MIKGRILWLQILGELVIEREDGTFGREDWVMARTLWWSKDEELGCVVAVL